MDVSLLERETLNLGRFLENIQHREPSIAASPLFPESINSKLAYWERLAMGSKEEQERRATIESRFNKPVITFGLVKYLQDKWDLKLDLAQHFTGAVPESVMSSSEKFLKEWERQGYYMRINQYDTWAGLLQGRIFEPASDIALWCGCDIIKPTNIFQSWDVYIEVDKDDSSNAAVYVRSQLARFSQVPGLPVDPDDEEEMAVLEEVKKHIALACLGSSLLMLAPPESFSTSDTLQERLIKGNDLMREYYSKEWHLRRIEKSQKKVSNRTVTQPNVIIPEQVRKKPAKDPVLLLGCYAGFIVLGAWTTEADHIYNLGEKLRLI